MVVADPGIPVGGTKGASVHVGELARAFLARGAEVLIVAERAAGPAPLGADLHLVDPGPLPKGPAGELGRIAAGERLLAEAAPLLA
ncbi:MAG: glycosyltransferase family 4 protein, partial [Acidimicrobiales bacterium]